MASVLESRVLKVPKHPKMENIQKKLFEINIKTFSGFCTQKTKQSIRIDLHITITISVRGHFYIM